MDVLTKTEPRPTPALSPRDTLYRFSLFGTALTYAVLVCAAAVRHERWLDEAQSWLLARDASLVTLWTRLLSYEGTPGLWHTLLHLFIRLGLPYAGINFLSAAIAVCAACVLLWRAPFPLPVRIALPFTFFLGYQYAVIARSYDLLPILLFCCAALYSQANRRPVLFTVLLCLLAGVSVHGMTLAIAIAISSLVRHRHSAGPRSLVYPAVFCVAVLLLTASAWPAHDGTFVTRLNPSFAHFLDVTIKAVAAAFTGEPFSSFAVIALSIPLLWRGGGAVVFALSALALCTVYAVIYSQVWHYGALFLAWLFAAWISWNPQTGTAVLPKRLFLAAASVVIAVQVYWTIRSVHYDWNHDYSASLAAARALRAMDLQAKHIYAIGFACIAIEPYFSRNIFANVNEGQPQAYWDWSRRNHVNEDSLTLAKSRPDYVIVGYKNDFERGVWEGLVEKSGYRALRHFDGNSFWQASIFEPESYDLFARDTRQGTAPR